MFRNLQLLDSSIIRMNIGEDIGTLKIRRFMVARRTFGQECGKPLLSPCPDPYLNVQI